MKSVFSSFQPSEFDALNLESIPGLLEHFQLTGEIPILVFRSARVLRIILNPFPGVWRISGPQTSCGLITGRNSFRTPLKMKAGCFAQLETGLMLQ